MGGVGGGEMAKWSRPLLFHSKLLCLSLLYLVTTISLTVYISLSQKGCIFRSPPPNQNHPLFSYPKTYGEHKYAIPTARSSCDSPVLFPDYRVALHEIRDLSRNSFNSSPVLRYLALKEARTFAGNFSIWERRSYFDHSDERMEVPCGFLTEFPVSESDRLAMEKCKGLVVVSAIFSDHDKIRQPKGLGAQTLQTACFFMFIDNSTLRVLNNYSILTGKEEGAADLHIGAWKIVRVSSGELPYKDAAMNGVIPKHLIHRLFPNSKFSIWLDAKMQLTVDPLLLIHSLLISKDADVALSKHPFNIHTMQEAMATARWKKWRDVESLRMQMEAYCENGLQPWTHDKLPYTTDVPDTAVILRRHGLGSNLFSCLLFNELEAFNPRDQLAFAYVRDLMNPKTRIHMFEVEAFEQVAVEYRHNLKRDGGGQGPMTAGKNTKRASSRGINGSRCEGYLLRMWGEE